MNPTREELESRCRILDDDVLLTRYTSGTLTELAQSVILDELRSRGIEPPNFSTPAATDIFTYTGKREGDLKSISRYLSWEEAHVLCALLESEGIDAFPADANLAIVHQFLSTAAGGVRVLVHEADLHRALQITDALKRGDYSLDEDHDIDAT